MPKAKTSGAQRKSRPDLHQTPQCGSLRDGCRFVPVSIYFRDDLPTWKMSPAGSQSAGRGVPYASILIPYNPNKGLCRLRAIDNATGRIEDDGLVDCSDASAQNSLAWKSLVDEERANEIRRSFRHR